MSFTYDFTTPNEIVYFAYCIPYSYSQLLKNLTTLPTSVKNLPPLKSLSGLEIPFLEITDNEVP